MDKSPMKKSSPQHILMHISREKPCRCGTSCFIKEYTPDGGGVVQDNQHCVKNKFAY